MSFFALGQSRQLDRKKAKFKKHAGAGLTDLTACVVQLFRCEWGGGASRPVRMRYVRTKPLQTGPDQFDFCGYAVQARKVKVSYSAHVSRKAEM